MANKKVPKNYDTTWNRRKQRIDEIEGLPAVTSADAGKIMKVDSEGDWKVLDDTSTMVPLMVTITEDPEYTSIYNRYSADVTHANIKSAIASGREVYATFDGKKYVYTGTDRPSAFERITFTMLRADTPEQLNAYTFSITEDEVVIYSQHALREELPTVDSEDNGDILTVVNGLWDKATPPTELPAVTSDDNGLYLEVINGQWSKNLLTEGSVIPERGNAILTYISHKPTVTDDQGQYQSYAFDIQARVEHTLDTSRYIDTTNLKVFFIINGLVIFNKPYNEVFRGLEQPKIAATGQINFNDALTRQYASLIPAGTNAYDLVYFRFMSDLVLGAAVPTT